MQKIDSQEMGEARPVTIRLTSRQIEYLKKNSGNISKKIREILDSQIELETSDRRKRKKTATSA